MSEIETEEPRKNPTFKRFKNGCKQVLKLSLSIGGFIFWATLLWLFLFEIERVRTDAMKQSVQTDEMVLITKWQYGARSPQRFWLPFIRFSIPSLQLQFPGLSTPKKEDVVAYYVTRNGVPQIEFGRIAALPNERVQEDSLRAFMPEKAFKTWRIRQTSPQIVLPKSRLQALNLDILQQNSLEIRVSGRAADVAVLAKLPYLKEAQIVEMPLFPFFNHATHFTLPSNHYLVIPDNRLGSYKAELVKSENLIGRAWRFVWAIDHRGRPQLDKLFRRIR